MCAIIRSQRKESTDRKTSLNQTLREAYDSGLSHVAAVGAAAFKPPWC